MSRIRIDRGRFVKVNPQAALDPVHRLPPVPFTQWCEQRLEELAPAVPDGHDRLGHQRPQRRGRRFLVQPATLALGVVERAFVLDQRIFPPPQAFEATAQVEASNKERRLQPYRRGMRLGCLPRVRRNLVCPSQVVSGHGVFRRRANRTLEQLERPFVRPERSAASATTLRASTLWGSFPVPPRRPARLRRHARFRGVGALGSSWWRYYIAPMGYIRSETLHPRLRRRTRRCPCASR